MRVLQQLLVLLLLTTAAVDARERAPFSFFEEGILPSGRSYSLKVEETPYVRRPSEAEDDGSRWGIDGGFPSTYCSVFDLVVDGEEIGLVRKLFEDLSHLSQVSIAEDGGDLQIEIRGGDAAGSFRAVLSVRRYEVIREVRHGEVPDSIWERLVVHNEEGELLPQGH